MCQSLREEAVRMPRYIVSLSSPNLRCVPVDSLRAARQQDMSLHLAVQSDWTVGIGGGVWTTALLLVEFIREHQTQLARLWHGKDIMELGTGTGLVGLSIATNPAFIPRELLLTDRAEALPLVRYNLHSHQTTCPVRITEYDWLSAPAVIPLPHVVLGTDVAYEEQLYQPVIESIRRVSGPETMVLLGITLDDSHIGFFRMLNDSGIDYCLLRASACYERAGFGLVSLYVHGRKPIT